MDSETDAGGETETQAESGELIGKATLPANWQGVTQQVQRLQEPGEHVYQRDDASIHIVAAPGTDAWQIVLAADADRAYAAPMAVETVPFDEDPVPAIEALAEKSNRLVEPLRGPDDA